MLSICGTSRPLLRTIRNVAVAPDEVGSRLLSSPTVLTGNSHDQYFFRRPEQMVAGAVSPPRLDLTNEDLLRAHVDAIWLAETQHHSANRYGDILDLAGEETDARL